MATLRKGCIFRTSWMQVRHRKSLNVSNPKFGPLPRRVIDIISKPVLYPDYENQAEYCASKLAKKMASIEQVNPYEEFVLKQCKKMFEEYRMIIAFQLLPIQAREQMMFRKKLHKHNIHLKFYNNSLMRRAVEGTKFQHLMPLFVSRNVYVASAELQVARVVKISSKTPGVKLLGGWVENHLLTREGIMRCALIPNIEAVHSQLSFILNSVAGKTHSLLGSHQNKLSANLKQYVKQSEESGTES